MTPLQHVKATTAFTAIVLNLCFWCMFLALLYVAQQLIPQLIIKIASIYASIYRWAVLWDDWILHTVSRIHWNDLGLALDSHKNYIVLSNHRSWFDIFLLQSAIVHNGPIIKFLCKSELTQLPIVNLIIQAYGFPVVKRRSSNKQSEAKRLSQDLKNIENACQSLKDSPAAMLIFPEGTRATQAKIDDAPSNYQQLLPPKHKGWSTLTQGMAFTNPDVLDFTLIYPHQVSFWECLGGHIKTVTIQCSVQDFSTVSEKGYSDWLGSAWSEKDQLLKFHAYSS